MPLLVISLCPSCYRSIVRIACGNSSIDVSIDESEYGKNDQTDESKYNMTTPALHIYSPKYKDGCLFELT